MQTKAFNVVNMLCLKMPFLLLCFFRYSILSLLFLEWEKKKKKQPTKKQKTNNSPPAKQNEAASCLHCYPDAEGREQSLWWAPSTGLLQKLDNNMWSSTQQLGTLLLLSGVASAHLLLICIAPVQRLAQECRDGGWAEPCLWPCRMGCSQRGGLGMQFVVLAEQQDAPCSAQLPSQCTLKAAHRGHWQGCIPYPSSHLVSLWRLHQWWLQQIPDLYPVEYRPRSWSPGLHQLSSLRCRYSCICVWHLLGVLRGTVPSSLGLLAPI